MKGDMNHHLPKGWDQCELSSCADVLDHLRVPVNSVERARRQGSIPYYGATGQVGWIDDFLFDEELVLIGEDGAPFLDKSKPISYIVSGKSWVNNHAHVLRARHGIISNQYLKYFLDSFDFHEYVNGTTRLKLTQGSMNQIPMLLAPLAEQRRIVAKLEAVFTKADVSRARLAKVGAVLKRLRQSVLAAACSGRLTAGWREQNGVEDDSADLPADWKAVAVGDVIESLKYGTAQKCDYDKRGVPVLRIPNLSNGVIDHRDLKYARLPAPEREQLRLTAGDILLIRSNGSVSLVGRTALVRKSEEDFAYAGYLIRLRPDHASVLSEFLNLVLGTFDVRLQIELEARSTSGVHNINGEEVRALTFMLPPRDEQREILRRVRDFLALADRMERRLADAQIRVGKLTPVLLAKAFRGELVPTEAEMAEQEGRQYESASVLLGRTRERKEHSSAEAALILTKRKRAVAVRRSGTAAVTSLGRMRRKRQRGVAQ